MFDKIQFKRYYLRGMALGLAAFLLLSGCMGPPARINEITPTPEPTPTPERGSGGTLTIAYHQKPDILNPHLTSSPKDWHVGRITYEPLASFDKDGNLIPFLAAQIPTLENGDVAPDGKSVTWRLKQDVKWSDGEPFTADDILFTYEFITNPATNAATADLYEIVDSIDVIDDYTVKINFKNVNPNWASPFVGGQGVILPRHVFQDFNGPNAGSAPANLIPIGTGPYKAISFKPQEVLFLGTELIETNKIVFEPNEFFREPDKPYFRRVEVLGGGRNEEAARSVLESGDVDYAWFLNISDEELSRMETAGKGRVVPNFGSQVERILLNRTDPNRSTASGEQSSVEFPHPFFSDKKVRQAFALAIDREQAANILTNSVPTSNLLVAPARYQSPNTSFEFNLEKAAALLDEAGWVDTDGDGIRDKDGVKMKVVYQTTVDPQRQQVQNVVKTDLESLGIEVELRPTDASIIFSSDAANPNNYHRFAADLMQYADGNFSPDPTEYMRNWTCGQIPQQSNNWVGENIERWCNPEYDALYNQLLTELDPDQRKQLFIQMNDLLIDDVVMIPVAHSADVSGVSTTIEGVDLTPWDSDLWNIKDWRRSNSP